MKSVIDINNLKFTYGENFILDVPALSIEKNQATGLVGNNGSGKSTLMELICGIRKAEAGRVVIDKSIHDGDITMLLQNPYLLKRSVYENMTYALKVKKKKYNRSELTDRAECILEKMSLDRSFLKRKWNQLSGGEAQRIALGARLMMNPKIMILDEPTTYIDGNSARIIKDVITSLIANSEMTFIIASHDNIWLNSICKDIYRMNRGQIIGKGNENIIPGPWQKSERGLHFTEVSSTCKIYASHVQNNLQQGLLPANDIILSDEYPHNVSAQNIVEATIAVLSPAMDSNINVVLDCGNLELNAEVTEAAARNMNLIPGKKIYGVFKATAIRFY